MFKEVQIKFTKPWANITRESPIQTPSQIQIQKVQAAVHGGPRESLSTRLNRMISGCSGTLNSGPQKIQTHPNTMQKFKDTHLKLQPLLQPLLVKKPRHERLMMDQDCHKRLMTKDPDCHKCLMMSLIVFRQACHLFLESFRLLPPLPRLPVVLVLVLSDQSPRLLGTLR